TSATASRTAATRSWTSVVGAGADGFAAIVASLFTEKDPPFPAAAHQVRQPVRILSVCQPESQAFWWNPVATTASPAVAGLHAKRRPRGDDGRQHACQATRVEWPTYTQRFPQELDFERATRPGLLLATGETSRCRASHPRSDETPPNLSKCLSP